MIGGIAAFSNQKNEFCARFFSVLGFNTDSVEFGIPPFKGIRRIRAVAMGEVHRDRFQILYPGNLGAFIPLKSGQ